MIISMKKDDEDFALTEDLKKKIRQHVASQELYKNFCYLYSINQCSLKEWQAAENVAAALRGVERVYSDPEARKYRDWYFESTNKKIEKAQRQKGAWICCLSEHELEAMMKI